MTNCSVSKCIWPSFGKDKKTGLPYCKSHQYLRTDTDKRSSFQKHMDKAKEKPVVEIGETELQKWFTKKMKTSKRVCENCGASLEHYNEKDWHGSQHHLFDKALYPSVKVHPINHCVLGMWCCHSQWHTNWKNAMKMPVFQKVLPRMITVFNDIAFDEKRKIPDFLITILDPSPFDQP